MKRVLAFLVSILIIITYLPINVSAADTVDKDSIGNTYYVDSANGDDANTGTLVGKPWKTLDKVNSMTFQPGDKLLFKAGGVWNGQLRLHGSGEEGKPIIIDMYGIGNKPIINGQGIPDSENPSYSSTIRLTNQQYIEINNLEITNKGEPNLYRRGIYVTAYDMGAVKHLYFRNLYIHDVVCHMGGGDYGTEKLCGAISCIIAGGKQGERPANEATITYFDDLKVENCNIQDIDRTGIYVSNAVWVNRGATTGKYAGPASWYPNKNVVVRNNFLNRINGDGIIVRECKDALVEYNTAKECHYIETGFHVAMWPFNSDGTVFQNNEVYLTRTNNDGLAFDNDADCKDTVFQYNYTHENEGGAYLLCNFEKMEHAFNDNTTIRYNISQNDYSYVFNFSQSKNFNNLIYNNTIYIGKGLTTKIFNHASLTSAYNNIFYNLGSGDYIYDETCNFDNNCYFGNKTAGEPVEDHGIYTDPKLINPGSSKDGMDTVDGYRLKANSPCINAGKVIENNGGKDFFGNKAPFEGTLPDIGACEYQGKGKAPDSLSSEFDSNRLDKGWKFIRENKDTWSLEAKPDNLRISTEVGDLARDKNDLKNILVKPVGNSDFVLTTKLDFAAGEGGQSAGLIIYGDDDNYYTMAKENLNGPAFVARSESNGINKMLLRKGNSIGDGSAYIKIEKNGDTISSYFSGDGKEWTQVVSTSGINIKDPKIGLYAGASKTQKKSIDADFEYIHYDTFNPNPDPIVENFDSTYLDGRWDVVKENSEDWSLNERPGYLRIKAGPGTLKGIWNNNIKNIFLTKAPIENFSTEMKMDFLPEADGQDAGLIIYQDENNYVTLSRTFYDDGYGRYFALRSETGGTNNSEKKIADVTSYNEMYLKLVKVSDQYEAYIRTDGSPWYLVGKTNGLNLNNPMVGFYTTKGKADTKDINLDVNMYKYQPILEK